MIPEPLRLLYIVGIAVNFVVFVRLTFNRERGLHQTVVDLIICGALAFGWIAAWAMILAAAGVIRTRRALLARQPQDPAQ